MNKLAELTFDHDQLQGQLDIKQQEDDMKHELINLFFHCPNCKLMAYFYVYPEIKEIPCNNCNKGTMHREKDSYGDCNRYEKPASISSSKAQ